MSVSAVPMPAVSATAALPASTDAHTVRTVSTIQRLLQQTEAAAAAAASSAAVGSTAAAAVPPAASDTLRVAALVLLSQLAPDAPAAAVPAPAVAAASASASSAAAASRAPKPAADPSLPAALLSALPNIAASLHSGFFVRLLGSGNSRLPRSSLAPLSASQEEGASYVELALRALIVLTYSEEALRVLLQDQSAAPTAAGAPRALPLLDTLCALLPAASNTLNEEQRIQLALLLRVLDRVTLAAAALPIWSALDRTVFKTAAQSLVGLLLPLGSATLEIPAVASAGSNLLLCCVRTLGCLLPVVWPSMGSATQEALARGIERGVAAAFEQPGSAVALAALPLLVFLQTHMPPSTMQPPQGPSSALSSSSKGSLVEPHLLQIRTGLEHLLSSQLDLHHRVCTLQLCLALLRRHGALFATWLLPSPSPSTAAASSSKGVPSKSHTRFLQLLLNIVSVELRVVMMEAASPRAADIAHLQGAAGAQRADMTEACSGILRWVMSGLVGEDTDPGVTPATRAFQLWNLPYDLLLFLKQKLDESFASMLECLIILQHKPAQPRVQRILEACVWALAEWMDEDEEATKKAEVHTALPLILSVAAAAAETEAAATTASASTGTPDSSAMSMGSLTVRLLPAFRSLASVPACLPHFLQADFPQRLVQHILIPECESTIAAMQALRESSTSMEDDDEGESAAAEADEARFDLLRHVQHSYDGVMGHACAIITELEHTAARQPNKREQSQLMQQMRAQQEKLRPLLEQCMKLAASDLSAELDLSDALEDMQGALELLR